MLKSSSLRNFLLIAMAMWAVARSGFSSAVEPADKPEPKLRNYAEGPLTIADFTGKAPDPLPASGGITMVASTRCQVNYNYRYRTSGREKRWTAMITELEIANYIEQSQSWNMRPESARILDHEQGHFDISEIGARRARDKMAALRTSGKLVGVGRDEATAKRVLEGLIGSTMKEINDQTNDEQKEYDRVTRHGIDADAQADERRKQLERLVVLGEKLNLKKSPTEQK